MVRVLRFQLARLLTGTTTTATRCAGRYSLMYMLDTNICIYVINERDDQVDLSGAGFELSSASSRAAVRTSGSSVPMRQVLPLFIFNSTASTPETL